MISNLSSLQQHSLELIRQMLDIKYEMFSPFTYEYFCKSCHSLVISETNQITWIFLETKHVLNLLLRISTFNQIRFVVQFYNIDS